MNKPCRRMIRFLKLHFVLRSKKEIAKNAFFFFFFSISFLTYFPVLARCVFSFQQVLDPFTKEDSVVRMAEIGAVFLE